MLNFGSADYRNIAENIFSSIVWFVLGVVSSVIFKWGRSRNLRRRIRIAKKRSFVATSLLTVSGSRFELTRSQLSMKVSAEEFIIAFPDQLRSRVLDALPDFLFGLQVTTPRVAQLISDAKVDVPDFEDLLASSATEVANELVGRVERLERVFNGELFHVLNFGNSATYDDKEDPVVSLEFYRTDYFTHQVVHKAFTHIRNRRKIVDSLDKGHITPSIRFFLNGFGLNCIVCAFPDKNNMLSDAAMIFGKRSARVANNAATGMWHVTANEALSKTDVEDQRISIDRWIRRALDEEAGIRESEIVRTFIFNVVIGLTDMQPGMLCLVMCEIGHQELTNRIVGSQDGMLEYDAYHTLPFDDRSIAEALDQGGISDSKTGHTTAFSPSADNILRNVLARGTTSFA